MKKQILTAVIAAVMVLSAGFVGAKDIEFTLIRTAVPMVAAPIAAPVPALPAALPINIVRPQGFGSFRGDRLEKTLFTSSLVAMTVLNIADYITTKQALKYPGLSEGNPIMKPFTKNAIVFAAVKGGITILSVWGAKSLFKRDKTTAWVVTTISNFLLSYVVANNMRLVSRMRPR